MRYEKLDLDELSDLAGEYNNYIMSFPEDHEHTEGIDSWPVSIYEFFENEYQEILKGVPMGMFDYIEYKADCEKCSKPLNNFQSKDGDCLLNKLEPTEVRSFHAYCHRCKHMNYFKVTHTEYTITRPKEQK